MHDEKRERVGQDERGIEPAFFAIGVDASTAHEEDGDTVVLTGVVPRGPGQVGGEKKGSYDRIVDTPDEESDECQGGPDREEGVRPAFRSVFIDPEESRSIVGRGDDQDQERSQCHGLNGAQAGAGQNQKAEEEDVPDSASKEDVPGRAPKPRVLENGMVRHSPKIPRCSQKRGFYLSSTIQPGFRP